MDALGGGGGAQVFRELAQGFGNRGGALNLDRGCLGRLGMLFVVALPCSSFWERMFEVRLR